MAQGGSRAERLYSLTGMPATSDNLALMNGSRYLLYVVVFDHHV